jgi:hypothetical protein
LTHDRQNGGIGAVLINLDFMKAIIILLTAVLGSYVTVLNVQHQVALQKEAAPAIPAALPVVVDNGDVAPVENAESPADSPMSVSDLTRTHGEPVRKERSTNGTTAYYYPYHVYYVRNYAVINSRSTAAAPAPAQNNSSQSMSAGRLLGVNSANLTTTNGVGTAQATTNPCWQGRPSSLGVVSLNGSRPSQPASTNPGWQGGGGATAVSAPRTGVVHQSSSSVQYRSTGSTFTGSSSQWQH